MPASALLDDTLDLLKAMIGMPSVSGNEKEVADFLEKQLGTWFPGCVRRAGHNLIVDLQGAAPGPALLLCSHIDTVSPARAWTRPPFAATVEGEKIYGLGANDAGASVVSMIAAARASFPLKSGRLILCFAAEEEAGSEGFVKTEPGLPRYDAAIFGEPTNMGFAQSLRGSMRAVMRSHGIACHASRPWEGRNACDAFAEDLRKLRCIDLKDNSPWKQATVEPTVIHGGNSTNQIPDLVEATLDIRTTPEKNNDWMATVFKQSGLDIEITVNRRKPMAGDPSSSLIKALRGARPDLGDYVFNGTCDMAFAKASSIVMGPGRSERSHAADEFIAVPEIAAAIDIYTDIVRAYLA
ncbi:MAG: M20/M25/M40 family metallo-hydrolase [Alphaproteobacteria bacterium]|nr:M20/M25/M40 family metallo-hydrolase [Alphaproteobacteria bacterium]